MLALKSIFNVDERHLSIARKKWWKWLIAEHWHVDPRDVETWSAEEVLEALAAIAVKESRKERR